MVAPFVRKDGGGLMSRCCCTSLGQCLDLGYYEFDFRNQFSAGEAQSEHIHPYPMCMRTAIWCQRTISENFVLQIDTDDFDYLIRRVYLPAPPLGPTCLPTSFDDECGKATIATNRPFYWSENCSFNPTSGLDSDTLKFAESLALLLGDSERVFRNDEGDIIAHPAGSDYWSDMLAEIVAALSVGKTYSIFFTTEVWRWARRGKLISLENRRNLQGRCADELEWDYFGTCKVKIRAQAWEHSGDLYCEEACS